MAHANMSPVDQQPPQRSFFKTCLLGCLIIFVAGIIITSIGGYVAYRNFSAIAANLGDKMIDGVVDGMQAATEEKSQIKTELRRVTTAIREKKLDSDDLKRGMETFAESPVVRVMAVNFAKQAYLDKSGLSTEERQDGERTLQRVVRGAMEKSIPQDKVNQLIESVSDKDAAGRNQIKQKLTDDELRKFLADAREVADAAQVPDEEYKIDLITEVRKVVDQILNESAVEEEAPEVEVPGEVEGEAPAEVDGQVEHEEVPANR